MVNTPVQSYAIPRVGNVQKLVIRSCKYIYQAPTNAILLGYDKYLP